MIVQSHFLGIPNHFFLLFEANLVGETDNKYVNKNLFKKLKEKRGDERNGGME